VNGAWQLPPATDSIASAIAYAELLDRMDPDDEQAPGGDPAPVRAAERLGQRLAPSDVRVLAGEGRDSAARRSRADSA
jgi:hypothetical protein